MSDFLFSTEDTARLAGVTPDLLYKWAGRGHITRHGKRRSSRWDWREVCAYLEKRKEQDARRVA